MNLHEPENPEYAYTFYSWHSRDKGKIVWSVAGPGIPGEPQLSGSHNQFDSHLQVQAIIGWLNRSYQNGKTATRDQIKSALGIT